MEIRLGKVEDAQFYINKAFGRGKKKKDTVKDKNIKAGKKESKDRKYKNLEIVRLTTIKDIFYNDLNSIIRSFPRYDGLDPFYKALFTCVIDVDVYKKSLANILWAQNKIVELFRKYNKILSSKEYIKDMTPERNAFLGRSASIIRNIKDSFTYLEEARRQIKVLPNVKTSLFTVAIAGFPNVGKSTLLSKLTGSKPEIAAYAFTTKGLMIGHVLDNGRKIQVIDTPGTLNRFEKMNNIERMAHLAMKHLANVIVYVFDLSEPYPIDVQLKLFNDLKTLDKKIIVYFSKSDILDKKLIDKFEIEGTYDVENLKKMVVEEANAFYAKEQEKANTSVDGLTDTSE